MKKCILELEALLPHSLARTYHGTDLELLDTFTDNTDVAGTLESIAGKAISSYTGYYSLGIRRVQGLKSRNRTDEEIGKSN